MYASAPIGSRSQEDQSFFGRSEPLSGQSGSCRIGITISFNSSKPLVLFGRLLVSGWWAHALKGVEHTHERTLPQRSVAALLSKTVPMAIAR